VRDVADALLHLSGAGEVGTTYNVGSGSSVSVGRLSEMAGQLAGVKVPPTPGPDDAVDDCSCADVSRLSASGWSPRHEFEAALSECWEWIRRIVPGPE
jgi:nucleoside-diphosphate-sugar epimerase